MVIICYPIFVIKIILWSHNEKLCHTEWYSNLKKIINHSDIEVLSSSLTSSPLPIRQVPL